MIPPNFPPEWKDADLSDPIVRKAFADWLEERGDWRADEIRRLWIKPQSLGSSLETYDIMRGPISDVRRINLAQLRKELVELIHHMWYTERDWRVEKERYGGL